MIDLWGSFLYNAILLLLPLENCIFNIVVGEALQIGKKRREAKDKGAKERYIHLNTEFQKIARTDKKAFLSDQCKETGKQ